MSISVVILTLNEEINLPDCLESCGWSDDVVVFDSFSTDATTAIAESRAARVVQRRFDNYAAQRNAALCDVRYKHPWLLMVDADERVPAELVGEMRRAVAAAAGGTVMFRVRRKDFLLGRWMRRSSGYPTWFGRLARLGHVRVEREINEEYVADGAVEPLQGHLLHYPFNKGITYWLERHNRYSSMEAAATLRARGEPLSLHALVSANPLERRRAFKKLLYRLPMRPAVVFLYLYVLRLGFLDGRAGWAFSRLRASYEMFIDLKVLEARRRGRGEPV